MTNKSTDPIREVSRYVWEEIYPHFMKTTATAERHQKLLPILDLMTVAISLDASVAVQFILSAQRWLLTHPERAQDVIPFIAVVTDEMDGPDGPTNETFNSRCSSEQHFLVYCMLYLDSLSEPNHPLQQ